GFLAYRYDIVYVLLDDRKIWRADVCPQSIRDREFLFGMNQSACVERLGRIISINWFGCDYFDFRSYRFRCHRGAAEQPATADWTNHDIEIGNILEHFYRRCALSRHDVFVFERVNQDRLFLRSPLRRPLPAPLASVHKKQSARRNSPPRALSPWPSSTASQCGLGCREVSPRARRHYHDCLTNASQHRAAPRYHRAKRRHSLPRAL